MAFQTPGSTPATEPVSSPGIEPPSLFRRLVQFAILLYIGSLTLLFVAMEFIGERFWPLAILLYLPQRIFLLPLIVLIPAALLAEVSIGAYALLASALIIFLWHVPFYPGMGGNPDRVKLKIITNNYGQNHGLHIEPFISAENPDFVALEDVWGLAPALQREYPDRFVTEIDQFVFVSRAPIKSASPLVFPTWRGNAVAAIFVVPWHGEDIAFYTVHLPSPRGDFAKLGGLGLVKEIVGRNRRRSDNMSFSEAMTARCQLGRDLGAVFQKEQRPFVAVGDFNMPQDGYVHRVVTWGLLDAFEQAGTGFGFTFPWDTSNPLTLGGAWLRIDYVLAGPGWRASDCRVEPERRSQHRAVVAELSRN